MSLTDVAKAALVAGGHMDESGATRRPRPAHCRACRLAITAAISDAGFTVKAWPVPTTALGELQALMAGLRTYTALPDELLYRDASRIRGNDADARRVLVEHRCGDPPPPGNPIHAVKRIREYAPNEPPPF